MIGLLSSCALGAAVGAQHALEPDHLAAVTTMVADHPRRAAWMGALWGLGHAAALTIVGFVLIAARAELPAQAAAGLELAVAAMLIVLGTRNLVRAWSIGTGGPVVTHRHGARLHSHAADQRAGHVHVAGVAVAVRPLVVGLIHGLAGSGGLAALAVARMPSTATALAYIALFGIGSIAGMAMVSGAFGVALGRVIMGRTRMMVAATGAVSIACGLLWGWSPLIALV